eukprot:365838_1
MSHRYCIDVEETVVTYDNLIKWTKTIYDELKQIDGDEEIILNKKFDLARKIYTLREYIINESKWKWKHWCLGRFAKPKVIKKGLIQYYSKNRLDAYCRFYRHRYKVDKRCEAEEIELPTTMTQYLTYIYKIRNDIPLVEQNLDIMKTDDFIVIHEFDTVDEQKIKEQMHTLSLNWDKMTTDDIIKDINSLNTLVSKYKSSDCSNDIMQHYFPYVTFNPSKVNAIHAAVSKEGKKVLSKFIQEKYLTNEEIETVSNPRCSEDINDIWNGNEKLNKLLYIVFEIRDKMYKKPRNFVQKPHCDICCIF